MRVGTIGLVGKCLAIYTTIISENEEGNWHIMGEIRYGSYVESNPSTSEMFCQSPFPGTRFLHYQFEPISKTFSALLECYV